ncbi:MAG: FtsK/SpoIIIE domain-containing protein [Clostridium sp.]|nr:FtsK/SpoIIIE domain-containing protein [Clostridium sp.]
MARYICSVCYKEMEQDHAPEFCPGCGTDAGNLQIIESNQINDEMETTMSNLRLLLKFLDSYVEKVRGINADYKKRLEAMQTGHSSQLRNCADKHAQELSEIEYEKTSVLEQVEIQYKNTLSAEQRKADSYRREQSAVNENSRKYRDDIQKRVESGKKHIEHIMSELRKAEAHIIPKKYHKMAKAGNSPTIEVAAANLDGIMVMNPMFLANELNTLNEKFLRRIIKASEINRKFIEFYSMRMKAEQLYQKELAELNAMLPYSDTKAQQMITEACQRFSMQMSQHEKDAAQNKQNYVNYCAELNQKYYRQRCEAMTRHAQQKKEMLAQHEKQLADLDAGKKNALLASYQAMQQTILSKVSPKVIADTVKTQKARAKALRNNFAPANAEPENITVGSLEYKLDRILSNRLVSNFMTTNYQAVINGNSFVFPFTIGLNQNLCLMFKYNNAQAALAKDHIQTICLNAFLSTPPNKMRFHFFDPLKTGQSFAVFKHFEDDLARSYNVILGGIQTENSGIEQQLQIIVGHIKTMQINTFKGQYKNIREYNAANILNPQPYNIVGIMDFPAGFTAKSVDLLQQIVATGKECGVYAVIMCNTDNISAADAKSRAQIKNIESAATVYELKEKGYFLESKDGMDENMIFTIDSPLSIRQIVSIAPIIKQGIKDAGRITIDYKHIAPSAEKQFTFRSDEGLVIPIGMSGASDIQHLTLGQPGSQSVHALIAGQIGSGKSRLLHAIITSSILQYSNEELEIYLVDFKSGTEFKIYADYNLPNFKVIAIESEQEFGLSVLRYIMKEGDRRSQLFNSISVSDITAYNNRPEAQRNGKLPRMLVVIDEFHELFNSANAAVSTEASRLLDNILRLKRSYGVHVILCTQSVRGLSEVNEAAMAQIAVRIALKCPKEDAEILLGAGSDAIAQIEDNDAGSAVYLPAISTPKTNNRFRVGYISPEDHNEILKGIEEHYAKNGSKRWDTRVLVSDVADSRDSVFQEYLKRDHLIVEPRKIHFGESLNIDRNLSVLFELRRNENMLLAGKDAQKAQNLLFFITLDLVMQKLKAIQTGQLSSQIYVFNFNDSEESSLQDKLQDMAMLLPDYIEGATYYDALDRLKEVYNLYQNKQNDGEYIWIILSNLGLASDFQNGLYSNSSRGFLMLDEILRNGPQKGVFTIAWHDDLTLFRQKFPNMIDSFKKRIAFNLSDEEALNFADVVKDPSINKNNAVFFEAGKGKQKFRPYSAPNSEWFNEMMDKLSCEDVF